MSVSFNVDLEVGLVSEQSPGGARGPGVLPVLSSDVIANQRKYHQIILCLALVLRTPNAWVLLLVCTIILAEGSHP